MPPRVRFNQPLEFESHPYVAALRDSAALSDASKRSYLSSIRQVVMASGLSLEQLLNRPEKLWQIVCDRWDSEATRRNKISPFISMLRLVDGLKKKYEKAYAYLSKIQSAINESVVEKMRSGEMTQREKENMPRWSDVVAVFNQLLHQQKGGEVSDECLVLAMYVCMEPLRQDFGAVRLFTHTSPPSKEQAEGLNYMVLGPGATGTLVLQNYKTSKAYGRYERSLPPNLVKIIRMSLRHNPRDWLFAKKDGLPYERNSFTAKTNTILNKIFAPKKVGVSMLRHSFISAIDHNNSTTQQLFEVAKNMAHSLDMQLHYRKMG